jgi:hypothetical protein
MILAALLNGLFGVICGLRFRVLILAPLTVVAVGEMFFLKTPNDTWTSISLSTIILIFSIEIGYFGGAILSSFRLLSDLPLLGRKWNKLSLLGLGLLSI